MPKLAVIPGDGIGPEVVRAALGVLEAVERAHHPGVEVEMLPWGADHYLATGVTIPPAEMQRLGRDVDAIFIGAIGDPRVPETSTRATSSSVCASSSTST